MPCSSPFSIGEGRIKVSTLDGSPDDGLTIRAALKALAAKSVGGSFRWAVNTSLSGDLQVQVTKSFFSSKKHILKAMGENSSQIGLHYSAKIKI